MVFLKALEWRRKVAAPFSLAHRTLWSRHHRMLPCLDLIIADLWPDRCHDSLLLYKYAGSLALSVVAALGLL
jgi:hypothetical protein